MGLELRFANELGEVLMTGSDRSSVRIKEIEGLAPPAIEYNAAVYAEYDGQQTISKRASARAITVSLELVSESTAALVRRIMQVFSKTGTLYIKDENLDRRIECSQIQIPDAVRVLKGKILTFAVQFVCANPYFEDRMDSSAKLYKRNKLLSTPFTLPRAFGSIVTGAEVEIMGVIPVEPIITISYPQSLAGAEYISIQNTTTGKGIVLNYAPVANEVVTIDVKNRAIKSSVAGNIIRYLSDDTFLGDFVLVKGKNVISADMGDIGAELIIECRFNNLYQEAIIA